MNKDTKYISYITVYYREVNTYRAALGTHRDQQCQTTALGRVLQGKTRIFTILSQSVLLQVQQALLRRKPV